MEAVLIECAECKALNRLSRGFPEKLKGEVGELACFRCGGSIEVDLTGSSPTLRGGTLVVAAEVALAPAGRTSTSLSPHTLDAAPEGDVLASPGHKPPPPFRRADPGFLPDAEVLSSPEPSLSSTALESAALNSAPGESSATDSSATEGAAEEPSAEEPTNPRAAAEPLTDEGGTAAARSGGDDALTPTHLHGDVHPPRPWELDEKRKSAPPAEPDETIGLRPLEPFTGVRLTTDGRLINATDEPEKRSRQRFWLPLGIAAAGLVGLIAGMQGPRVLGNTPAAQGLPQQESSSVPAASAVGTADEARADQGSPEADQVGESASVGEVLEIDSEAAPATLRPNRAAPSQSQPRAAAKTWTAPASPAQAVEPSDEAEALPKTETDEAEAPLPGFSKEAALAALERASASTAGCRKGDDPYGSAQVVVTFAPSGRVTSAVVSGHPFAGTAVGGCIANRLRTAQVPAFSGDFVTVSKTVVVQ